MSDNSQQAVPDEGAASPRDGRLELNREYTDEELRNSPYIDAFKDAVVGGSPDEYRSGPSLHLRSVLAAHQATRRVINSPYGSAWACRCGKPHSEEHVAAMWREACTIRTAEQLDALPVGAVVRNADGVWETDEPRTWVTPGHEAPFGPQLLVLPALLVWHPEWDAS